MAVVIVRGGGIEQYLPTTGDLLYAQAANSPARLGIGSAGQLLQVVGGVPAWANPLQITFGNGGIAGSGSWAPDVVYVYAKTANAVMAFDVIPSGAQQTWIDIVDRDIVANGVGNYEALNLRKFPSGRMTIGAQWAGTGVARPLFLQNAGGGVGIGGSFTTIDPSAMLELNASNSVQGFLPPRMTTNQRTNVGGVAPAMASPAEGLIVYDTTLHKLMVRTASAWETITSA